MTTFLTVLFGLSPTPPPSPTPSAPSAGLPGPSRWLTDVFSGAVAWCLHRPWLAAVAVAALIAGYGLRAVLSSRRRQAMARHATSVTITALPACVWVYLTDHGDRSWGSRSVIGPQVSMTRARAAAAVWKPRAR